MVYESPVCVGGDWKLVDGFDMYEVSTHGQVRSFHNNKDGRIVKQYLNHNGHYYYDFCTNGNRYKSLVSRCVAIAFIPNPLNLPCVSHIDKNLQNNNVNNLRWCSYNQIMQNMLLSKRSTTGEKNISWDNFRNCWRAQVMINSKTFCKRFDDMEDAVKARDDFIMLSSKTN